MLESGVGRRPTPSLIPPVGCDPPHTSSLVQKQKPDVQSLKNSLLTGSSVMLESSSGQSGMASACQVYLCACLAPLSLTPCICSAALVQSLSSPPWAYITVKKNEEKKVSLLPAVSSHHPLHLPLHIQVPGVSHPLCRVIPPPTATSFCPTLTPNPPSPLTTVANE